MLEAAQRRPDLVAMVCPAPSRLPYEPWFRQLVAEERLGPISLVELVSRTGANLAIDRVTWRERIELSGKNTLMLGIYAETLNAWFGPYRSLTARLATPVPAKRAEDGSTIDISIPQVVESPANSSEARSSSSTTPDSSRTQRPARRRSRSGDWAARCGTGSGATCSSWPGRARRSRP